MRTPQLISRCLLVVVALGLPGALPLCAQVSHVPPRITEAVNETKLTVLRGNTHPLARPEFDRGAAPASLPMERMLLVLQRSPEQEAALEKLMAEQQDPASPNYHHWLSPQEFGQKFGPADQDIQLVASWLASHGFQVANVSNGRTVIEFSGNAAQVQAAFHTAIHKYVLANGEEHWANAGDPAIPTALAPVVAGVHSLHNFFPKPMSHIARAAAAEAKPARPLFTFPSGCTVTNSNPNNVCQFLLGPADFATIYNVAPLYAGWDGSGVTIAIVSDSNIDFRDVSDFRTLFNLPPNVPNVITPTTDPGLTSDEVEAILDVEWSGAVAKNATIDLVASPSTGNTTFGGDLSATYIVNCPKTGPGCPIAVPASILSESFGACELGLGSAQNAFYNSTWQQAAAEGITVSVSTGDDGSAGCDFVQGSTPAQPALSGLAVNGIASTPYNVAVGGTDFDDPNPALFWNLTNSSGQLSAQGYVPEMTYNDSCTNSVVYQSGLFADLTAEAACNDPAVQLYQNSNGVHLVGTVGGSGGASSCTTYNGTNPLICTGGYAKPAWQTGAGVPNDGKRDLPDISLFAGDGTISGSAYVVCNRDYGGVNGINGAQCSLSSSSPAFLNVGGTSVSAQAFAGIMALIDQKLGGKQGLVNPVLYKLKEQESAASCNSSNPASACVFHDVTVGTISQPCLKGSPNCNVSNSADAIGVLSGCDAAPGYNLATGLGSFNANNLASKWASAVGSLAADFQLSLVGCSATAVVAGPGGSASFNVTIASVNGFNGAFTPACSGLPSLTTCSFSTSAVDATHSKLTVTVVTTAPSLLPPSGRPAGPRGPGAPGGWTPRVVLALVFAFCTGVLLVRFREGQRRWSPVLAALAFACLLLSAACGGSGSSGGGGGGGGGGGNPGTPVGVTMATLSVTSGATTHTLNFTVSVQ